jgi:lauroyl/myristoyl acyltransferase
MALTEYQETTMAAMAEAFRARMEELFPLPEEMSEQDKATIRANWEKLGQAVAAILPATMTHITSNAEIGTVTSDVVGAEATQNNTGAPGLLT